MIVPGLQRVLDSLGSFGLSVDNDGIVTGVVAPFRSAADSPAAVAGIVPGDRIDLKAMRCIPLGTPQCSSLVAVLGGLGGTQFVLPQRQITLTIDPRSGAPPKTVNLGSVPAPLNAAARVVLFADTVVGAVVIIIAFWLVWTRPGWMTWGLFLYVIWINPGQSFTYYALLQPWPLAVLVQEFAEALAQGAAFAGFVIFALRFPNDRTEPRWRKVQWLVPFLAVAIFVLTLLSFFNMFGFPTERITEITFLTGLAVDAAVLLILLERRRTLPPQEEKRMRWVIWGCAIGLPTFILAELLQSSDLMLHLFGFSPSQAFIGLLYLPNGVLAYLASQAVWQRRVVSVSIPLRHGTVLLVLTLALGVPIFQIHEKLTQVEEGFRLPAWVWALVIAPVVLLLLNRLHELAVELVDHVFNRQFHAIKRQLKDASEGISRAQTLLEIDRLLVENSVQALCLSSGAVFRNEGNVFRRTHHTKGWHASMKSELHPQSDAAALRSLELGAPVRLTPDTWNSSDFPTGMDAPCLSLPVRSEIPEATAIVLLGPHETGNDIDADEREMLDHLAVQAAAAYERVVTTLLRQEVAQLKSQLAAVQHRDETAPASS
ncbi:MAG TPA: hypothetical protein VN881_09230 [Candidatus Acidoferrales bacterium]|nr:hypothetical protein [Candidatus Acidoferrales bacterium]